MNIAIIGAGFTGLAAGYTLTKKGHKVTIFEKDPSPGGLAIGYREKGWEWTLEKHYHHWFTNDHFILELAKAIDHDALIRRPKTSVYSGNSLYQLDSPVSVMQFPRLTPLERLRMSLVLGFLKFDPVWKPLEKFNAATTLPRVMGKKAYEMIWEPLLLNKFGAYANDVSLAWFWARIYKRTPSLAYPAGGYLAFAEDLVRQIEELGGTIHLETEINELSTKNEDTIITFLDGKKKQTVTFDRTIVTTPSPLFIKIAPSLPTSYTATLSRLKSLGAINLVLRLEKPFFSDNTYWLSVCEKTSPIMAIVEHTNFMDKHHYNNEHIVYLGNYLPREHTYFTMTEEEIFKDYDPFLKKLNPDYKKHIIGMKAFKAPFAQPIIPVNYSKMLPPFETPLHNVFLANIEQVYPWDRGTNYAVELGEKVADLISNS